MLTAHPSNVLACKMDWGRGSRGLSVKGTKDQIDQILILLKDIIACLREVIIGPGVSCAFTIIYPSHGYTALVEDEICKKYQAILAS